MKGRRGHVDRRNRYNVLLKLCCKVNTVSSSPLINHTLTDKSKSQVSVSSVCTTSLLSLNRKRFFEIVGCYIKQ